MDVDILFEDDQLLVVNKPAGLIVNNSDTTLDLPTLQKFIQETYQDNLNRVSSGYEEFLDRSGIVHRLDKETSGVLIVAKTPSAFENLKNQFKERLVEKEYLALVHGALKNDSGQIVAPVGRLPWNRKRFGVLAGGREATTDYKKIKIVDYGDEELTLVRLMPKTGRTHQIRVHLKHIDHPIFADPLYAGRKVGKKDREALSRIFLHAERIRFKHPITGKVIEQQAPLPKELEAFLG